MLPVSRSDPELAVVYIRRHDLLESSLSVLGLHKVHECIVDVSSSGQEEAAAGTKLMKEEQLSILQQRGDKG